MALCVGWEGRKEEGRVRRRGLRNRRELGEEGRGWELRKGGAGRGGRKCEERGDGEELKRTMIDMLTQATMSAHE